MILAHRIAGPPSGLPLLLIHPLGADQTFWDETRLHFGDDILSISCDLRGSGASPNLTEPLSLATTVSDIEALRHHLGLSRIVVAGCAVGAMAAAAYAAQYPEHAAGLIMANPGSRILPAGAENLRQRAEMVRRAGMGALLPAAIENAFLGYANTPARVAYEQRFLAQSPENYAQAALGAATSDITTMATTITCPVLMVPGANDLLFGQPHADELAEIIPHAVTVPFSDGAHFIPYQQPVEFAAVVRAFLQDKRLGRGA